MSIVHNFKPGDMVSINGDKYIVVKNYGTTGLVKECKHNGTLINHFNWTNKKIDLIESKKIDEDEIKKILKEFESIFKMQEF